MSKLSKTALKRARKTSQSEFNKVIQANIRQYPFNISKALELSANQCKRTYAQAQYAWYGQPSNNIKGLKTGDAVFATITTNGLAFNTKVALPTKQSKLKLKFNQELIDIANFTQEDKVAFFDIMFK